ncbi:hypothetical protein [Cupriavidus basilensis]
MIAGKAAYRLPQNFRGLAYAGQAPCDRSGGLAWRFQLHLWRNDLAVLHGLCVMKINPAFENKKLSVNHWSLFV